MLKFTDDHLAFIRKELSAVAEFAGEVGDSARAAQFDVILSMVATEQKIRMAQAPAPEEPIRPLYPVYKAPNPTAAQLANRVLPVSELKFEADVYMQANNENPGFKIARIKAIRMLTGWDLSYSKKWVEDNYVA